MPCRERKRSAISVAPLLTSSESAPCCRRCRILWSPRAEDAEPREIAGVKEEAGGTVEDREEVVVTRTQEEESISYKKKKTRERRLRNKEKMKDSSYMCRKTNKAGRCPAECVRRTFKSHQPDFRFGEDREEIVSTLFASVSRSDKVCGHIGFRERVGRRHFIYVVGEDGKDKVSFGMCGH